MSDGKKTLRENSRREWTAPGDGSESAILMAIAGYALGAFRCDPEFGEAVMWSDGGMYEDELGVGE